MQLRSPLPVVGSFATSKRLLLARLGWLCLGSLLVLGCTADGEVLAVDERTQEVQPTWTAVEAPIRTCENTTREFFVSASNCQPQGGNQYVCTCLYYVYETTYNWQIDPNTGRLICVEGETERVDDITRDCILYDPDLGLHPVPPPSSQLP